ncbi:hypothetical protein NitaMp122 (mitochondrion) [Nicotiana tabacum]|uniref:Uncharacterized protein n=1 Tax=Nicotiana tabacum TaxID=4097 RepID=Q5M9V3_TOBAC|nr:hypothetical protein NitaMp122 [Nicotiana tabacum]BAD83525.1 hypothetical protein [Nicotiana tabacum]
MLPLLPQVMEMLKFELVFSCLLCLAHSTLFAGGRIRLSKLKSHSIHIISPTTLLLARLPTRMRTVRLTPKKNSHSRKRPPFCLSCLIRLSSQCLIRIECILSPYRTKGFDRIFLSLPEFNQ